MSKNRLRIPEIDLLRGIAVLMMIIDHIAFDIWYILPHCFSDFPGDGKTARTIYRLASDYWDWDARILVRYFVLLLFFGLTGVCCAFSRSNVKRGVKLMGLSLLITAATYGIGQFIDDPDCCIVFGALHCIAASLLITGLLEKCQLPTKWFLLIGAAATVIGTILSYGAPMVSYGDEPFMILLAKMILGTVICGGDCFPLIPYCGIVLIGVYFGRVFYGCGKCLFPRLKEKKNPIYFFGRHSLPVYLGHQVVLPVLIGVVLLLFGYTLSL